MVQKLFLLFFAIALLSGCLGRRFLHENEKILFDQSLTGASMLDKEEIKSTYAYKPNDRILRLPFSPYVNLYEFGVKTYDSTRYTNKMKSLTEKFESKINKAESNVKKQRKLRNKLGDKLGSLDRNIKEGNWAMRLGEPLAVYDTTKEKETVESIEGYMKSKGYFNATVDYAFDVSSDYVTSHYNIIRGEPYFIDSTAYYVSDMRMLNLLNKSKEASLLVKGDIYEENNLTEERDRIYNLMINNGYYEFTRQYIDYLIDSTTIGNRKVLIGIRIRNDVGNDEHRVFKIDSVIFRTDASKTLGNQKRIYSQYNQVTYQYYKKIYSERILDWRTFLNVDSLYSRSNTLETQKQLSNMDIFKFINVSYDTTGGHFIANINTSPLDKFQTSGELGLNVSNGLPGPFVNTSIKNRNTFRGLEVMELSGRAGFVGLSGATETKNPYSSLDYSANLTLTFPQFAFPFGNKFKASIGQYNPKTRASIGYNSNYRLEYLRKSAKGSLAYNWENSVKRKSFTLSLFDVSFINSKTSAVFDSLLQARRKEGNNLINSFKSAYVNSIWYRVIYDINNYGNAKTTSAYLRYRLETGGNTSDMFKRVALRDNIELYKFVKTHVEYRHMKPLTSQTSLVGKIFVGVSVPYGSNKTLPYEKFYFAGGSNSIRAWNPRRLGPGAYLPVDSTGRYDNRYEQTGEILLETGIEFRHKLFGFIKGAIFIDAGNSWTIREDPSRPGSQFKFQNLKNEIAIGAGYGIRFDLSFLILRLDVARKIHDPGRITSTETNNRGFFELPKYSGYSPIVWNLGIGYPF